MSDLLQLTPQAEAVKKAHESTKLLLMDLSFLKGNLKNAAELNDPRLFSYLDNAAVQILRCARRIEKKYGKGV